MTDRSVPLGAHRELILGRRLPWLLVFRVGVATVLLLVGLAASMFELELSRVSMLLYAVVIATYLMVVVEGLLIRIKINTVVLGVVHLGSAVGIAIAIVQGTGGVRSAFSFLYLLAILDGAIIAGRKTALVVATVCTVTYGAQLFFQYYGLLPFEVNRLTPESPGPAEFISAVAVHTGAFYLIAILAGHLAGLLDTARQLVSSAKYDLQRVLELHAAVLESLPLGVITIDTIGHVSTANQAAAWILDIPINNLLGREIPPVLHDFIVGPESYRTIGANIGEKERHLSLSRSRVTRTGIEGVAGEKIEFTLVVMEDRTDLYALEGRLREKEKLAGVGELAAGIAHEIRNPLASMSGALELLCQEDMTNDEQRVKLRSIVSREVDQLNRLVEDFLVYARPAPPKLISVDVCHLIREVVDSFSQDPLWGDHQVALEGIETIKAQVDPEQIRQLLWNLLRNAMEASPVGASVRVVIEEESEASLGWFVIKVVDKGAGIDSAILPNLFEPFKTTKETGTGLGLSIVHRIVENHGGHVEITCPDGGGTVVNVIIPIAEE